VNRPPLVSNRMRPAGRHPGSHDRRLNVILVADLVELLRGNPTGTKPPATGLTYLLEVDPTFTRLESVLPIVWQAEAGTSVPTT
jgi:hypothetical protein